MTDQEIYSREAEIKSSIAAMQGSGKIDEGEFATMGILITGALLSDDETSLRMAHDGLRRLSGQRRGNVIDTGRLLGLLDITYWSLRRLD